MATLDWSGMPIHQAIKADWSTHELLIEGSLGCAKSTLLLDKEVDALLQWPGIPILLSRWTEEAVSTKLQKAVEEILAIRGITADWDAKAKQYRFANGSIAHMFGLKGASATERFSKLRSLGVCRIAVDQAEELDRAVADELRARLRPDLTASLRGARFPFQITFAANPNPEGFWLSKQFPLDNHIKGRRVFSLSVFDNPHLPSETIDNLVRTWNEAHPKHRTMILGQRGLNIDGDPVYDQLYNRDLHAKEVVATREAPLLEGLYAGTHNPCWIAAQRTYQGGLRALGGIIGRGLALEDFLPIIREHRRRWFGLVPVATATAPMGETYRTAGSRYTLLNVMRAAGITPVWRESANAPDVRLAMIEYLASLLRRRLSAKEEAFGLTTDPSRWLEASTDDGVKPQPFLSFGFEGGYIWSPYSVSVSNKEIRDAKDDDWYFNAMRCLENIALNFCVDTPSDAERERQEIDTLKTDAAQRLNRPALGEYGWLAY